MAQANYLIHKAPQLKDQFVAALHKVPLFQVLPPDLLDLIFSYSRFVHLTDGQVLFKAGAFDQSVYLLLNGSLEVYIEDEEGKAQKIDEIKKPFSLTGERSIMGEPQTTTAQSKGESLMIGLDLSGMPDVQDAFENPEGLLENEEYVGNLSIYTILATVLTARLERLIKDQYKLSQKIDRINETAKTWKTSEVMALIFNQFVDNQLPGDLKVRVLVHRVLQYFRIDSPELRRMLKEPPLDTEQLYMELVRLDGMGVIPDFDKLLLTLIRQFTVQAIKQPVYKEMLIHQPPEVLPLISLAKCLQQYFDVLEQTHLLQKDLSYKDFLSHIGKSHIQPSQFLALMQRDYLKGTFAQAYAMFLFCREMIDLEEQINQRIQERVSLIRELSSTRQNLNFGELDDEINEALMTFEQLSTLVE